MRIGIIGAGQMAGALGGCWARAGHEVRVGGRAPERAVALAGRIGAGASGGTLREAAGFGEVTLLAAHQPLEALRAAGAAEGALAGRPLIDCTNAFAEEAFAAPPDSFVLERPARAEEVAAAAVGAHVVKAFNVCAAEVWEAGGRAYGDYTLGVPLCGDDARAVEAVAGLVTDLGLRPVRAGGLGRARYLEAMTAFVLGLWFAGEDPRELLPPLGAAFAVAD